MRFTFTEGRGRWTVTNAECAPLLMITDRGPMRVLDVDATLASGSAPELTDRLVTARDRTAGIVASRGAVTAGAPRRRLSGHGAQPPIVPGWPTW